METLCVITPVTRPAKLSRIAVDLASLRDQFGLHWIVVFSDGSHPDWWGGWERNEALESVPDHAWVWFLDDDNTVHPEFGVTLAKAITLHSSGVPSRLAGFVFSQVLADGSMRLPARVDPNCGEIDTAMFVFQRTAIGNVRWRSGYNTDWAFFREVIDRLSPGSMVAVDVPVVYYNALEGDVRCRLCHSTDTHPLPFRLPPSCPTWVRCRTCGSDTAEAAYEPGLYGPTMSAELVRLTGGIERCRDLVRSNCEWFATHHSPGSEQTFLDVGCGDGAALDVMQSLGWAIHGFDVTPPHYAGSHVTVAPVFHRWLFPQQYGAVLCREVLEHIESPDFLLHELHGVCVPGGLVQIQTPRPLMSAEDPNTPLVYCRGHLFVASPVRLREMLTGAMLDVIDERHWPTGQAYLCRARA